jgi:hypothetical protein
LSVKRLLRAAIFKEQDGRCCWEMAGECLRPGEPMQLEPYRIKGVGKNKLHASFEHVKPQRDGGDWSRDNIKLAHAIGNWSRS